MSTKTLHHIHSGLRAHLEKQVGALVLGKSFEKLLGKHCVLQR